MSEVSQGLTLHGYFGCEIWEPRVSDGLSYWRKVSEQRTHNGITLVGLNDLFEQYLRGGAGLTFYIGLIDSVGFSAVDNDNDTMASHAGWSEITEYDEGTRPAWSPDAVVGRTIANSNKAIFTFNTAKDIKGMFLTSDSAKNGTAGILFATGIYDVINAAQPGRATRAFYQLTGQEGAA